MSPPPGLCQAQHRWEGERRARSRHPCPASAPHSPPLASARGPRLHRRRHLCAPGRVPQGAQPRDPCHHRSRPGAPSAPPPPQLPPPPSGLLRDPEPGRLGGQQVALLPPAPRGPSAAPPAPPSPARPSPPRCDSPLPPPPSTPPARPAVFWRVPSLSSACASLSAASLSASVSSSSLHLWVGP